MGISWSLRFENAKTNQVLHAIMDVTATRCNWPPVISGYNKIATPLPGDSSTLSHYPLFQDDISSSDTQDKYVSL